MEKVAQPFVKWLGGKRQLLKHILPLVPSGDKIPRYYEPFAGGAALFFALSSRNLFESAHLNDLNSELIAAFRTIQGDVDSLIDGLKAMPVDKGLYDRLRLEVGQTDLERAKRLLYLTRLSFNGLYRVNSKGQFNATWGAYTNPRIVDEGNLRAVSKALVGVTLTSLDFEEAVSSASRGDFVYLDPPYVPLNPTSSFTSYTSDGFGIREHERLARTFFDLKARGANVLLSNSDTPFVRSLYRGANFTEVQARRSVNSKGNLRGPVGELLISPNGTHLVNSLTHAVNTLEALYQGEPWFHGVRGESGQVTIFVTKKNASLKTLVNHGWMGIPVQVVQVATEGGQ